MKTNKLFFSCLLALICAISSCNNDDKEKETTTYPITTVLGERTCTGEIAMLPNPPHSATEPVLPGMVLGLKTDPGDYLLKISGHWLWDDTITIEGVVYSVGDQVEITGTASTTKVSASDGYSELEIKTIKRLN